MGWRDEAIPLAVAEPQAQMPRWQQEAIPLGVESFQKATLPLEQLLPPPPSGQPAPAPVMEQPAPGGAIYDEARKIRDEMAVYEAMPLHTRGSHDIERYMANRRRYDELQREALTEKPYSPTEYERGLDTPKLVPQIGRQAVNLGGAAVDLGKGVLDFPTHLAGQAGKLFEDSDPYARYTWTDEARIRSEQLQERRQRELGANADRTVIPGLVNRGDVAALSPNAAYTGVVMGAGVAGGAGGALAGSLAGPGGTAVGAATGRFTGAAAAAMKMSATDRAVEHFKVAEEVVGRPLSDAERKAVLDLTTDDRLMYALWEAGPEAVGTLLQLRGMGRVFGAVGKEAGKAGSMDAVKQFAKGLADLYVGEAATETVTRQGQYNLDVERGYAEGKRSWTSPSDLATSAREVIPQTVLLSSVLGGGAAATSYSIDKIRDISARIKKGGAPSRGEAKDLNFPEEAARTKESRREYFEANRQAFEDQVLDILNQPEPEKQQQPQAPPAPEIRPETPVRPPKPPESPQDIKEDEVAPMPPVVAPEAVRPPQAPVEAKPAAKMPEGMGPGTTFTIPKAYPTSRFKILDNGQLLETNSKRLMGKDAASVIASHRPEEIEIDPPKPEATETPAGTPTELTPEQSHLLGRATVGRRMEDFIRGSLDRPPAKTPTFDDWAKQNKKALAGVRQDNAQAVFDHLVDRVRGPWAQWPDEAKSDSDFVNRTLNEKANNLDQGAAQDTIGGGLTNAATRGGTYETWAAQNPHDAAKLGNLGEFFFDEAWKRAKARQAEQPQAPTSEPTAEQPKQPKPKPTSPQERAVRLYAVQNDFDPDEFYAEAEIAHKALNETYEAKRNAKRYAHAYTKLDVEDVSIIVNSHHDHSSGKKMPGVRGQKLRKFDRIADDVVKMFPEAFDRDAREDAPEAVWELMKEQSERKDLHIDDPKVLAETVAYFKQGQEEGASFDPAEFDAETFIDDLVKSTPAGVARGIEAQPSKGRKPLATRLSENHAGFRDALSALRDELKAAKKNPLKDLASDVEGSVGLPNDGILKKSAMLIYQALSAGVKDFKVLLDELKYQLPNDWRAMLPVLREQWNIVAAKFKLSPAEESEPDPKITSIKNRIVEELRAGRGLEAIPGATPETREQWLRRAEAKFTKDPEYGEKLVARLLDKPRGVGRLDTTVLQFQKRFLNNELIEALEKYKKAEAAGDAIATADAEITMTEIGVKLEDIDKVARSTGTAWGRTGVARQIELAEDFSIPALIAKAMTRTGGKKLNAEQTLEIERLSKRVADLERKLARKQAQRRVGDVVEGVQSDAKRAKVEPTKAASPRMQAKQERAKKAIKNLNDVLLGKTGTTTFGGIPVGPEIVSAIKEVVVAYVDLGVASLAELMKKVRDDAGNRADGLKDVIAEEWAKAKKEGSVKAFKRVKPEKRGSMARFAGKVLKSVIAAGVTDRDKAVDEVHKELLSVVPDFTREDTEKAITDYGSYKLLNKDPIEVRYRQIKHEEQQLIRLRDILAGRPTPLYGAERDVPHGELRHLIAQVNEARKAKGYKSIDPIKQIRSALEAAKRGITNRIADLKQEIDTRDKIVKERTELTPDAELLKLRGQRDELLKQHKEIFGSPKATEAQKIAAANKLLDKQITELEGDMKAGDIWKKKGRKPPLSTPELDAKRARLDELRERRQQMRDLEDINRDYRELLKKRLETWKRRRAKRDYLSKPGKKERTLGKEEMDLKYQISEEKKLYAREVDQWRRENMNKIERAQFMTTTTLDTARAIMTSFELSATLRQGGLVDFGRPEVAAKAFAPMLKAALSERGQFEIMEEIRSRENAPLYERAKLGITESDAQLLKQEEAYAGSIAKYIPGVAASERAYVTFLNRVRADLFDTMAATLSRTGEVSLDEAKLIANFVNVITGRGPLGKLEVALPALIRVFFAPRFVWSRFQFWAGYPIWAKPGKGSARVRRLIAKEYARILIGYSAFYGSIALASSLMYDDDDDDKPKITFDPRSSDFGKIVIGNTHLDPMAGLSQALVASTRLLWGETKTQQGQAQELDPRRRVGVLGRFLRTKLSPWFGTAIDFTSGENVVGEPVTAGSAAAGMTTPLYWRDVYDAIKDQGLSKGAALSIVGFFGMGMNTYKGRSTGSDTADRVFENWYSKHPREPEAFPGDPSQEITKTEGGRTTKTKMPRKQYEAFRDSAREAAGVALDKLSPVKLDPGKTSFAQIRWIKGIVDETRRRTKAAVLAGEKPDPEQIAKAAVEAEIGSLAARIARPDKLPSKPKEDESESAKQAREAIQYAKELKGLGLSYESMKDAMIGKMKKRGDGRESRANSVTKLKRRIN